MSENSSKRTSRTDWARIDAMKDDEIDTSDIPPLTEEFFKRAKWRDPTPTLTVSVPVDAETLAWYKSQDGDSTRRMTAALRIYAQAHKTRTA